MCLKSKNFIYTLKKKKLSEQNLNYTMIRESNYTEILDNFENTLDINYFIIKVKFHFTLKLHLMVRL